MRRRLERIIEKNQEEARALLTGRMPAFVFGGGLRSGEVPVFVFHDVEPETFERQLRYLVENGYRTLSASEYLDGPPASGGVLLTFDDATWTFHAYAFPLLRRHGCRAVLFAIPGLVPDDETRRPTLDDERAGRASRAEIAARARTQPLCTRHELIDMHASGLVDVQSHSMTHQRVPISSEVVDFLHPEFDTDTYGNVRVPVSVLDDPRAPARALALGAPVFRSAPRLAGRSRFVESRELVEALVARAGGDERFFARADWRATLTKTLDGWPAPRRGELEPDRETERAVRWEIEESKRALEAMLPGARIEHLCYPWFTGGSLADRIAAEAGYRATYYGLLPPAPPAGTPLRAVARLADVYLERLPGRGRRPLATIWRAKLTGAGRSG